MNDAAFTQWFAALVATNFHACMHGANSTSERASWLLLDCMVSLLQSATTAILTNLLVRCASRFSFLEFATALEAEYPKVLAKRMAACLRRQAERQQLQLGPRLSSAQKARHAWGVQTVKAQPLIP